MPMALIHYQSYMDRGTYHGAARVSITVTDVRSWAWSLPNACPLWEHIDSESSYSTIVAQLTGLLEVYSMAETSNSDEFFIGSEVPGVEPTPKDGFKDKDHKIKKQAARFRVYAFDKNSKPLGEVTSKDYNLTWNVHVANKKGAWVIFRGKYMKETWQLRNKNAKGTGWPDERRNYDFTNTRKKLIIDSGEQTIQGENTQPVALGGEFWGSQNSATPVKLGEIRTDEQGRLLVLASDGDSFSITPPAHQNLHDKFDNDDWVDKMCDGSVRVTVKSKSQPELEIRVNNRATIITAPPRFASGTHCPTTLYELIEDIYEKPRRGDGYDVGEVVYYRDIYPLFNRVYLMSWTNNYANKKHGPDNIDYFENPDLSDPKAKPTARLRLFNRIRAPVIDGNQANADLRDKQASERFMPRIAGDAGDIANGVRDRWASLTQLQYDRLEKWSKGQFTTGEPETLYKSFDDIPLVEQPNALTRSALEWSVGAPLFPGIEVFWIAQKPEMYKPEDKFRYADTVLPGDLGKGLCLPWQADFNMCNTYWWPSVRPDDVVTNSEFQKVLATVPPEQVASSLTDRVGWSEGVNNNSDMVRHWNELGFVSTEKYGDGVAELPLILTEKQRTLPRSGAV